ncbi:hypothetical protein JVT61DRAFT_14628 [Boletus reticuloceps]|uniref:Uncharacterized protein n=1 Tax=Boletus reticuloceps TaxID=495285 RepID=A0A8I2YUB2_9AGAM|nr:hypothetical protein JVT61DRAFT_14628 [Boletus reticuloceps]
MFVSRSISAAPTLQRVTYQTYRIDTELNCLTGNVSLTNKLYLACLHALTSSGYGTDPLTGKSGTEEALGLLRSASCRSTIKFSVRDAELLRLIASLCPSHSLHRHKNMQVVHWLNLPVRSHNHRLYLAAKEIKRHVTNAKLFHDGWETKGLKKFPSHDDHLYGRSLLRAHHLLPSETSEQFSRGDGDATYHSRDLILSDSAEHRAFVAATAIFQWSVDPAGITMKDLVGLAESWKSPLTSSAVLSFTYQRSWLNPHFPAIWIKAYNALRETKKVQDRFKLLFSLSSMAYSSQDLSKFVPTLLAFAVHPEFRAENLPAHSEYDLSDGYRPTQPTVVQMVLACAREFYLSPESSMPARPGESSRALGNRRRKAYKARLDEEANYVADQVVEKWSPDIPAISIDFDAYDCTRLDSKIQDLSQSCSRNIQLRKHLTRVQGILRDLDPGSPAAALGRYSSYSPDHRRQYNPVTNSHI